MAAGPAKACAPQRRQVLTRAQEPNDKLNFSPGQNAVCLIFVFRYVVEGLCVRRSLVLQHIAVSHHQQLAAPRVRPT